MVESLQPDGHRPSAGTYRHEHDALDDAVSRFADVRCQDTHGGTDSGCVGGLRTPPSRGNGSFGDESVNVFGDPAADLVQISNAGQDFTREQRKALKRFDGIG